MRLHTFPLDDRPDPVELRDLADRPTRSEVHRDDVEPDDFDDVRIAKRHGVQDGRHFAFENLNHPDFEDVF
jgi:hypothetical protein